MCLWQGLQSVGKGFGYAACRFGYAACPADRTAGRSISEGPAAPQNQPGRLREGLAGDSLRHPPGSLRSGRISELMSFLNLLPLALRPCQRQKLLVSVSFELHVATQLRSHLAT